MLISIREKSYLCTCEGNALALSIIHQALKTMEQTAAKEPRKYNVMTSKDIKVRWITLGTLKAMLAPYMSAEEAERLAMSKKPPFTRKTFRRTYFDGDKVQQYIDKNLKDGAAQI